MVNSEDSLSEEGIRLSNGLAVLKLLAEIYVNTRDVWQLFQTLYYGFIHKLSIEKNYHCHHPPAPPPK